MKRSERGKRSAAVTVLFVLFGTPLLLFGLFMAFKTLSHLGDWMRSAGWMETDARIISVELADRDESYVVVCRYVYHFQGHSYENARVGLIAVADGMTSWHQRTCARLKAAKDRNETVTCYVNPAEPAEAVLDRSLRPMILALELTFAVIFTGIGGGVIAGAFYYQRQVKRRNRLIETHPDQPWMWHPHWRRGVIQPSGRWYAAAAWATALFWNLISWLGCVGLLPKALAEGPYWIPVLFLFPLIGLGMLYYAVRMTLQDRRFAGSHLLLETIPGVIGGHLRGELVLMGRIIGLDKAEVTLLCVRRYRRWHGGDSESEFREDTIWKSSQAVDTPAPTSGQSQIRIPIDFQIPYACKSTNEQGNDRIQWRLIAKSELIGSDLDLSFDVPVFRTAGSDASISEPPTRDAAAEAVITSQASPAPDRMRRERDKWGNFVIVSTAWPGWNMVLGKVIVSMVFGGVAVFEVMQLLEGKWFALLFALGFGGFALAMPFSLWTFFGGYRMVIDSRELRVERWRPIFARRRVVPRAEVRRITAEECTTDEGTQVTRFYTVHAETASQGRLKLADMIEGRVPAQWFVRQVSDALGIEPGDVRDQESG